MDSIIARVCIHCKQLTEYEELIKDKRKKDGVIAVCKKCLSIRIRNSSRYKAWKKEHNRKYREDPKFSERKRLTRQEYHSKYLERVILSNAKCRAKKYGLAFNIDETDIIIPDLCPLLNIPIFRGTNESKANSPSLDRIDTTKGYIKGNCRVISYKANTMKNDADPATLRMFIKNLEVYLNNDIV